MLTVKIFDDDDFKRFEDAIAKAMVRALRTVMKEGTIAGYKPPVAEKFAEPAANTELPPTTTIQPGAVPPSYVFGKNGAEPIDPPSLPSVQPSAPPPEKRKNRKLVEFCESVAIRPTGYITAEQARAEIGGEESAAQVILRTWIFDKQVTGVIVCDRKMTPTKGMPGRLHVDRSQLVERNRIRKLNATLPVPLRRANGAYGDHAVAAE
jgi:hypothetical protein